MTKYDVLCVGAVNIDTIALVDHLPAIDERAVARQFTTGFGGPASTAAVALARQGHSVAVCASVGSDPQGDAFVADLQAEGVGVEWITRDEGPTARSIVLVDADTRSRAIVTSPFRSHPRSIPVDAAEIIHTDQAGYHPAREAIDQSGRQVRLSIDAGNPIEQLSLAGVWLYSPTVSALRRQFGGDVDACLAAAHDEGATIVAATDGPRGSLWSEDGMHISVPGFHVDVASSLGAGDVFHGALLSAVIEGLTPERALLRANACAAMSCAGLDGRSAIPDHDALDRFLDTHSLHRTR